MVNVKGASVILWGFATVPTNLVAFPYVLSNGLPKCIINRIGILADIITNIVIDIFATITDIATFDRAVNSSGSFDRISANLTRLTREQFGLAVKFIPTRRGACFWLSFAIRRSVKFFAANDTSKNLFLGFPIAWTRAEFRLRFPIFYGSSLLFEKDFTTLVAAF